MRVTDNAETNQTCTKTEADRGNASAQLYAEERSSSRLLTGILTAGETEAEWTRLLLHSWRSPALWLLSAGSGRKHHVNAQLQVGALALHMELEFLGAVIMERYGTDLFTGKCKAKETVC